MSSYGCCRGSLCGLSFNGRYLMMELFVRVALCLTDWGTYHKDPFVRAVYGVDWYNHMFPHKGNTFPYMKVCLVMWVVIAVGMPMIVYLIAWGWKRVPGKLILEDAINFALGITMGYILTDLTTSVIKNMYGRPRPDYLSRCWGEATRPYWPPVEKMPAIPMCTNRLLPLGSIIDGRRSFPSGHGSSATNVHIHFALYTYRKLSQIKNSGTLRLIVPWGFIAFDIAILVSRTSDYAHFPTDVIGGAIVGTIIGIITWTFYDRINLETYRIYQIAYDQELYVHDPFALKTPAQFVPESIPTTVKGSGTYDENDDEENNYDEK